MNILLLCHRLPFPANKGDKIRSLNILEHLQRRHTVYLGTFMDEKEDYQYADTVRQMVGDRCQILKLPPWQAKTRMVKALLTGDPLSTASFYSSSLQNWVDGLLARGEIDRAVVFGSAMAPYLLKTGDFARRNVVFDMVDIDSDKWTQYAGASNGVLRMIYRREARTLLRLEREATQIFPSTLLVSSFEAATMASLAPESRPKIHTARNGVDTVRFSPDFACESPFDGTEIPIVMTGRMDYRPNHEGACWFAQEVLPLVRRSLPEARFYAVGAKPPPQLRALGSDAVTVTGSVDDIRPYIRHAAVVVAPLHMARGVQNKVLEAMAMQKRVVATTPATRALDVRTGHELWIANAPVEFAAAIIAARDGAGSEQIARNARRHVEDDYAWERNLAIFDGLLDGVAEGGARLPSRSAPSRSVPRDMQTSAGVR